MALPFSTSNIICISQRVCRRASKYYYSSYKFGLLSKRRLTTTYNNPFRVELSLDNRDISPPDLTYVNHDVLWEEEDEEDSEFVQVIAIGSQRDALLDFCLASPFLSPRLRFWNIFVKETVKVQLQQRVFGENTNPRIVEAPSSLKSWSQAVILVAGSAYASEFTMVLDILEAINFSKGLVVSIILKPFSFEGRRRQEEVKDLVEKLQGLTSFCIIVDANALLEKDLVTLDEALKTANNAVLMAMNAIFVIISELHIKLLDVPHDTMKELKVQELKKVLRNYKEAKIGFGAGYNIKTSILRAIYDCPFLGRVKDTNGVILFIFASSDVIDSSDVPAILHTFRQATEWKGKIITSIVHEPNLDLNLTVTTVITLGSIRHEPSQKGDIFSRLAQRFPFIFNIWRKPQLRWDNTEEESSPQSQRLPQVISSTGFKEMPNAGPLNGAGGFDSYPSELHSSLSNSGHEVNSFRYFGSTGPGLIEFSEEISYDQSTEACLERELLIGQEWTSQSSDTGTVAVLHNLSVYKLPAGVKPSGDLKDRPNSSSIVQHPEKIDHFVTKAEQQFSLSMSWDALTDASFEAITDLYGNTSGLLKGDYSDVSKKNGALSVRAASMLEAERDSQKKWSPIVETNYRGGLYVGRCQGGLPEGKGRLSHGDGSVYEGMWRYGKRSGLGTYCFCNGDLFRGSWRDDVMHGKGWFYFHTGDRWFVNFWKGKANGEGRFYSKNGDIFFGNFKDGWRDGHFLGINVDGSRHLEIWDEGVLVSRKELDSDADDG